MQEKGYIRMNFVRTLLDNSFTIVEHHVNSSQPDDPTSEQVTVNIIPLNM